MVFESGGTTIAQLPQASEFVAGDKWPPELKALFQEANKAYAAGAFTASAMVSRKVLMACACAHGEEDGKPFGHYVKIITEKILAFPAAKSSIGKIRDIGNDANHHVGFVDRDSAKRALSIISYMLNTIYSLPSA